jgi:hypothetical protein
MQRPHEIDSLQGYLERSNVREEDPDPAQASRLWKRAGSKFETMERLGIDEETATDYVENVYDSCKMLIQSLMSANGFKPYSHEAIIAYAIDELDLDMVNVHSMNRYRKLRNDIAYRGEIATTDEAKNVKDLYHELRSELEPKIEEELR